MNRPTSDWTKTDKTEFVLSFIVAFIGAVAIAGLLVIAPSLDQVIIQAKG